MRTPRIARRDTENKLAHLRLPRRVYACPPRPPEPEIHALDLGPGNSRMNPGPEEWLHLKARAVP
jgi:hypothetical protein